MTSQEQHVLDEFYKNAVMAVSEPFTNNAVRTYYHCIPKEPTGRYTLNMLDT